MGSYYDKCQQLHIAEQYTIWKKYYVIKQNIHKINRLILPLDFTDCPGLVLSYRYNMPRKL